MYPAVRSSVCVLPERLLKKPKILILDDSTSAVDTATDAKIRKAFATEIPNTTKLIIAQRISSIQSRRPDHCDEQTVRWTPSARTKSCLRITRSIVRFMKHRQAEAETLTKTEVRHNGTAQAGECGTGAQTYGKRI